MSIATDWLAVREVDFAATVARHLVHRGAIGEVLLTDCVPALERDTFRLGAQWPRAHALYHPNESRFNTVNGG